jgi:hypothetical protein
MIKWLVSPQTSTVPISSAPMLFTTTTTTRMTTTTSSTSFIKPLTALRAPSTIIGDTTSAPNDYDDDIAPFTASFAIVILGASNTAFNVANNGYFAISPSPTNPAGYRPSPLSNIAAPTPIAHFPFWDNLYFQKGETHGIFYQYEGTTPNESLTLEWYGTKYSQQGICFAHFLLNFYQALPGWATYR